jgi:HSP20 family molecular chaperone IbpA
MKSLNAKAVLAISLSLLLGFATGFASKELSDRHNTARANDAMNVPVHKLTEPSLTMNKLIGPELWRIYIDPLWAPITTPIQPLALPDFVSLPLDVPQIKTVEGAHDLQVIAQLPGLTEKDVDVEVGKDVLAVKGHKKEMSGDKNKQFSTVEQSFVRMVQLPCKVDGDKVRATLKNGVLTVSLPKAGNRVAQVGN